MSFEETIRAEVRAAMREEVLPAIKEALGQGPGQRSDADLLDTAQAAADVNCHEETIRRLVKQGVIPRHGHGRLIRVLRGELRRCFDKRHINGKPKVTPEAAAAAFLAKRGRE
jgi:excisionase family DNA binding protein